MQKKSIFFFLVLRLFTQHDFSLAYQLSEKYSPNQELTIAEKTASKFRQKAFKNVVREYFPEPDSNKSQGFWLRVGRFGLANSSARGQSGTITEELGYIFRLEIARFSNPRPPFPATEPGWIEDFESFYGPSINNPTPVFPNFKDGLIPYFAQKDQISLKTVNKLTTAAEKAAIYCGFGPDQIRGKPGKEYQEIFILNINSFKKLYPQIDIVELNGIASHKEFLNTIKEHDVGVSNGAEFFHDVWNHLRPFIISMHIDKVSHDRLQQILRERINELENLIRINVNLPSEIKKELIHATALAADISSANYHLGTLISHSSTKNWINDRVQFNEEYCAKHFPTIGINPYESFTHQY